MTNLLTAQDANQLFEQGYLVARGLLDVERDLAPVRDEYAAHLDRLAHAWHAEGVIPQTFGELAFADRLIAICRLPNPPPVFHHLVFGLPYTPFAMISNDTPLHLGPAAFGLVTSPRMLDALEALIGPEIVATPRNHMRLKLPFRVAVTHRPYAHMHTVSHLYQDVQWHQDGQTQMPCSDDSTIVTAWTPLTEANLENGTLAVVPGTHRLPLSPFGADLSEYDSRTLPIEASPGDVVFLLPRTMHRGLPNRSRVLRWSFDLRYMPTGQPKSHDWLPHFVVRSRRDPASELRDPAAWLDGWHAARQALAARGEPCPGRRDYAAYVAQTFIDRWDTAFGRPRD